MSILSYTLLDLDTTEKVHSHQDILVKHDIYKAQFMILSLKIIHWPCRPFQI